MADTTLHRKALRRLRRMPSLRQVVVRLDGPARALGSAMRRGPAVSARFLGVLDGRTLNIEIPLPAVAAAGVTGAELRIRRGRVRHSVPARIRAQAGGGCSFEATALLADGPRGLGLQPGAPWVLEAVVHTTGGTTSYAVVQSPPVQQSEGPTVPAPADPVTGNRYEARLTATGRLGLAVTPPEPLAEVAVISVGWLGARIGIRLVSCDEPPKAVEFTARTGEGRARVAATTTDGVVWCDIPLHELAVLGGPAKETFFDVHVRTGNRRLRVGRFLHDVVNPKPVLVPPTGIVWAAPGLAVSLRPYYTPAGSLTVSCRPIGLLAANGES
ncbi:hypothetical protein AMIS_1570 [Actinoplanes missouriensis 431]|uniref:Uncharacterized protein n=1 Tax=Actinoplanes missouriensis (strain ATCC 14538 / DSM 43046 / CBS 188.64 / JCM 3121 / NBRC 102363 / NCIMB 12654 / NRRL B-3342 / UNCC 431) TaxID=512565 RepID=I0GX90_ACTM4|nr:hypothetical protein [Actinoplanes missouriensis]BAL85377.1 hypothetical protein AMIS_1570 [Actinoplanes missouriensis 431]